MRHLDLFSGIGGFALAAQWVWGEAHEVVAFCEKDEWCRRVLGKHWPGVPIVEDVRDVGTERDERPTLWRGINLLTGGFPCQPFSGIGRRRGSRDDRYLWPEMFDVVQIIKPTWVVAENVDKIITIEDGVVFERVCLDLEGAGYDVQPFVIPACAVAARHRRDRVFFLAYSERAGLEGHAGDGARGNQPGRIEASPERPACTAGVPDRGQRKWLPEPGMGRVADGVPRRVDRLRGLGNAIVPQVAQRIFEAIKHVDNP